MLFIPKYTHTYTSGYIIYTREYVQLLEYFYIDKKYVTYNYTSIYTRVYLQLYKMDTFNYIYNYTRDICITI